MHFMFSSWPTTSWWTAVDQAFQFTAFLNSNFLKVKLAGNILFTKLNTNWHNTVTWMPILVLLSTKMVDCFHRRNSHMFPIHLLLIWSTLVWYIRYIHRWACYNIISIREEFLSLDIFLSIFMPWWKSELMNLICQ